ncbi:MAG: hypothetical protein QM692_07290 [Thermomicrobiales bacterium]
MVLALVLLMGGGPAGALAQAVDAARARDGQGCEDGVGSTYFSEELESALDNDTFKQFWDRRDACGPGGFGSYSLDAICSPAEPVADERVKVILCFVTVWNPSDAILLVGADQFLLASNSDRFAANTEVTAQFNPADVFGAENRAYPSDSAIGFIGFEVPAAAADDDFVLIWRVPNAETSPVNTWRRLQILLGDREQIFGDPADSQAELEQSGGNGGPLRIANTTDLVSEPVTLGPGTYRVTASYTGDSNFAVWVRTSSGNSDLLFNEVDSYSGQATFQLDQTEQVLFEVTGVGRWEIEVTPAFG